MSFRIRTQGIVWLGLASALLLGSFGTGTAAAAGLDRGYGNGGVAEVSLPGLQYPGPEQMVSARQGDVYVLGSSHRCGMSTCTRSFVLFHYLADGRRDDSFAGSGALALPESALGYSISVDEQGRPLAAAIGPGAVVVRRYTASGQVDAGFGGDGSVDVPCACEKAEVTVTPARGQRLLVAVGGPTAESNRQRPSSQLALTRLLPDGGLDSGFGVNGTVSLRLGGVAQPGPLAVSGRGAVLLAGSGCCTASNTYAIRVSARGRVDTKFGATVRRALRRLSGFGDFPEVRSVLPRGDGMIDMVGTSQFDHGFDLRLRPNGRLAAGFGRNGVVRVPMPISTASLGTNGAIMAANENGSGTVYRLFRNGRFDPDLGGVKGIEVPAQTPADQVVIGTQTGGRAVLMDLGRHFCRSGCPATPRVTAFLEGRARR